MQPTSGAPLVSILGVGYGEQVARLEAGVVSTFRLVLVNGPVLEPFRGHSLEFCCLRFMRFVEIKVPEVMTRKPRSYLSRSEVLLPEIPEVETDDRR